jgi:hypothetical protein
MIYSYTIASVMSMVKKQIYGGKLNEKEIHSTAINRVYFYFIKYLLHWNLLQIKFSGLNEILYGVKKGKAIPVTGLGGT